MKLSKRVHRARGYTVVLKALFILVLPSDLVMHGLSKSQKREKVITKL